MNIKLTFGLLLLAQCTLPPSHTHVSQVSYLENSPIKVNKTGALLTDSLYSDKGVLGYFKNGLKEGIHNEWYYDSDIEINAIQNNLNKIRFSEIWEPADQINGVQFISYIIRLDTMISDYIHPNLGSESEHENKLDFIHKKHPILSFLDISQNGMSSLGSRRNFIGKCSPEDTGKVNKMLKLTDENGRNFISFNSPISAQFLWGKTPIQSEGGEQKLLLYALKNKTEDNFISGEYINTSRANYDNYGYKVMSITFGKEASELWREMTKRAAHGTPELPQKAIAISYDNLVYSCPNVVDEISGGRSQISFGNTHNNNSVLIKAQGKYRNGLKHGLWKYFREDGKIDRHVRYKDGQITSN